MQNRELRYYCVGDFVIEYNGPAFKEKEYLSKFRIEAQKPDVSYRLISCEKMKLPEIPCVHTSAYVDVFRKGREQVRVIYEQDRKEMILKDCCSDGFLHLVKTNENWMEQMNSRLAVVLFDLPYQLIAQEALFLHASYVLWKGKAILFTAPKQTGKTTQAKLWESFRGATIVNGDRALLRKVDGCWNAYGSPYCGTSQMCENLSAPIGAVVLLSQAAQNSVCRAKTMEALIAFMDGASFHTWDKENVETAVDLMKDLIADIPIYKLGCTPTEDAVKVLEEVLW